AMFGDQVVDVVGTGQRHREAGERAGHRGAGGEAIGVVVDLDGFVVAGHHDDVVVVLPLHRALFAQRVEVRVGIGDELLTEEEVQILKVVRHSTFPSTSTTTDDIATTGTVLRTVPAINCPPTEIFTVENMPLICEYEISTPSPARQLQKGVSMTVDLSPEQRLFRDTT